MKNMSYLLQMLKVDEKKMRRQKDIKNLFSYCYKSRGIKLY
jgi:hypothetical protein